MPHKTNGNPPGPSGQQDELWGLARASGVSRRRFLTLMAAGGAAAVIAACTGEAAPPPPPDAEAVPVARVPLPPPDAKMVTTACDYCVVGCGYKVYTWPVGTEGGPAAGQNAMQVDFPVAQQTGNWVSPNMHNIVEISGTPHNVLVLPDWETEVVNVGGDHSIRGGTLAQKLYSKDKPTRDRLLHPQLRVDGKLAPISWDDAIALVADTSAHVLDRYGELAWGMKMYSYNYYENTYALTKLALGAVQTPCWAPHDKPAAGADTPGLSDAGINAFSASYEDWKTSEVIYLSGVSLYETKSILFQEWISKGGATLIVVNPRRDYTAAYAAQFGGLHLQLTPGTDTVLNNSIARVVLDNGWEDSDFIRERTANASEVAQESGWRRQMFGTDFNGYKQFIMGDDTYTPENAEKITGVPADKIRMAAEMLARPTEDGSRPGSSFMLEKGNYWGHNYENTASLAALGLLVGAGGRPGRVISRGGGHQRGMISGAGYPKDKSPDSYQGNKIELNLDRWVIGGNVRFMWAIGTTWMAAMGASAHLAEQVRRLTRETGPSLTAADAFVGGIPGGALNVDRVREVLTRPRPTPAAWSWCTRTSTSTWRRTTPTSCFRPLPGASRTTRGCRENAACAFTPRSWTRRARPSRTGGSSPRWPSGWATKASIGGTPTTCSKRRLSAPAAGCTTTRH